MMRIAITNSEARRRLLLRVSGSTVAGSGGGPPVGGASSQQQHHPNVFRKLYSGELHAQERKLIDQKKTFVKQLEDVAKHAPMETYFRRITPKDGYWKVLQNRDILNKVRESGDITDPRYQSDEMFGELEKLKKAIKDNSLDVESLIKFIDLQEEQNRLNRGSFASRRPQDIAEEHIHRILDAIKVNKRESILPVMLCEQMRKAEHSKEAILKKYQEATHNHPHDPMVWLSYLDYVQYDSNVYTVALMKTVFTNCIRKTNLLVSGVLMSHAHLIKDLPAFREFHLSVYLRYLKWCISNGCGPHAIALVQPGCFTTTEQVIAEFNHKNIFEGSALPNFPSVPNYNEKTCETMGLRIMAFLLGQRHEEKKTDKEHIDDQMMKYLLAGIETHAQRMEKDPKFIHYQFKQKHLKSLISSFAKSTEVYVNVYERLRHAQALFASLKCTVWLERAVAEQTELRRLTELAKKNVETEKSAVLAEHALMPSDVENLGKFRNSLWTYITTVTQSLEGPQKKDLNDPTITYPTVQLLLYSKILLARQYVASDAVAKTIRKLLAKDIMQEDDGLIEGLDAKGLLYLQLNEVLTDWTEMISKRDAKEESECVPEFPRVGALCQALLWAVEFVFLNQNKEPRKTINLVAQSLLEQFKFYEKNKKDFNRTEIQKYRDRFDTQQKQFKSLIASFLIMLMIPITDAPPADEEFALTQLEGQPEEVEEGEESRGDEEETCPPPAAPRRFSKREKAMAVVAIAGMIMGLIYIPLFLGYSCGYCGRK